MKWTVKLVAEAQPGNVVEQEVITIEREDTINPATVGLTIAEGKAIMESLQRQMVAAQVQRHGASIKCCPRCGKSFRTKGYYQSTLRSVYGKVPMRVRRIKGCSCTGSQERSYSTVFTNKYPITPELRYLTAKMAALLPFGKVTEFLSELLPLSAETSVNTVRNRAMKVGKRLQKSAEVLANRSVSSSCEEAVVGLDGGYVRDRHPRPERNFEIVAGKVLDEHGAATRFAFVRQGGPEAASAARLGAEALFEQCACSVGNAVISAEPPFTDRVADIVDEFVFLLPIFGPFGAEHELGVAAFLFGWRNRNEIGGQSPGFDDFVGDAGVVEVEMTGWLFEWGVDNRVFDHDVGHAMNYSATIALFTPTAFRLFPFGRNCRHYGSYFSG